ncbi:MAG TPA: hypothetical protein PL009_10400 [Flavipsychrobacter sp.]|nr:hypothetical protein [Flavipsychrobacter sp.]
MPLVIDRDDAAVKSEFMGLRDLRPQISHVYLPFFDVDGLNLRKKFEELFAFVQSQGDIWEFGYCDKDNFTGAQIDEYLKYSTNENVFLPVIFDLFKADDTSTFLPYTVYQSSEGNDGLGYILVSDLDPTKENVVNEKINRIEDFKTRFAEPTHQKVLDRIVATKKDIEQASSNIESLTEELNKIPDGLYARKKSLTDELTLKKTELSEQADKTLIKIKRGEITVLEGALALLEKDIKKKEREIASSETTLREVQPKLTQARSEMEKIYSVGVRKTLATSSNPNKFRYAKKPKNALNISFDHTVHVTPLEGRPEVVPGEERIVCIDYIEINEKPELKLSLKKVADESDIATFNVIVDGKDESKLKQLLTKNKIFWPEKGFCRGVEVNFNITLNFDLKLSQSLKAENGDVLQKKKYFRIKPAANIEASEFFLSLKGSSANQIRFKGELSKNSKTPNNWYTSPEKCLKFVKSSGKLVHKSLDFSFAGMPAGFRLNPGGIGKCARFTHTQAANYISMLWGFAPIMKSPVSKEDMVKSQASIYEKAKKAKELSEAEAQTTRRKADDAKKVMQRAREKMAKSSVGGNTLPSGIPSLPGAATQTAAELAYAALELKLKELEAIAVENARIAEEELALLREYENSDIKLDVYPAGGNARDLDYHGELLSMGYTMTDLGRLQKPKLVETLNQCSFKSGDILVYWCDDFYIDEPLAKQGYKTYGHTCIYAKNYKQHDWMSDFGHSAFVYGRSKGVNFRCLWFKAPEI